MAHFSSTGVQLQREEWQACRAACPLLPSYEDMLDKNETVTAGDVGSFFQEVWLRVVLHALPRTLANGSGE
jgi:hypothetical protein